MSGPEAEFADEPFGTPVEPQLARELLDHLFDDPATETLAGRRLHRRDRRSLSSAAAGGRRSPCCHVRSIRPALLDSDPYLAALVASSCKVTAMAWAAFGSSKIGGPSMRTRFGPPRNKAQAPVLAMADNSAPTQRVSTNSEWTFASAWMRPSIACLQALGVSECERLTVAWTIASRFLLRCSASRASVAICSWFRFCSVMSLAIFDAPTILPSAFLTGETVSETTIRLPFLRCRTVSKWSMRSPRLIRSGFHFFVLPVFRNHDGDGLPIASSAV